MKETTNTTKRQTNSERKKATVRHRERRDCGGGFTLVSFPAGFPRCSCTFLFSFFRGWISASKSLLSVIVCTPPSSPLGHCGGDTGELVRSPRSGCDRGPSAQERVSQTPLEKASNSEGQWAHRGSTQLYALQLLPADPGRPPGLDYGRACIKH